MLSAFESSKTKIARRVIEVMEYFASGADSATVMDIVRSYGRPQSSTSELLGALVELGLLYKDPRSRSYVPTPRMAALGQAAQPAPIADGRLFNFMDRLAQVSRLGVGLFGMVGTQLQVFRWIGGEGFKGPQIVCGTGMNLAGSAIGLLLLSTLGPERASKMLWRLHAESAEADRFSLPEANAAVDQCGRLGHATGEAGLIAGIRTTAVILPRELGDRPLAIGVLYRQRAAVDPDALVATLNHGIAQLLGQASDTPGHVPSAIAV